MSMSTYQHACPNLRTDGDGNATCAFRRKRCEEAQESLASECMQSYGTEALTHFRRDRESSHCRDRRQTDLKHTAWALAPVIGCLMISCRRNGSVCRWFQTAILSGLAAGMAVKHSMKGCCCSEKHSAFINTACPIQLVTSEWKPN